MSLKAEKTHRVGIMQPYFFPYLGYFATIAHSKKWLVFDTPQYSKRSWINRNRVLHPSSGWQYVTVPVQKASLKTPINQIRIRNPINSCSKILRQLEHYKKSAPFFKSTMELIENIFNSFEGEFLDELNILAIEKVCQHLGIKFNYSRCSDYQVDIKNNPLESYREIF